MKTNKKFWHCFIILLIVMLYTGNLQAQVMIGSETLPKDFSLLEITAVNKVGGLRLPQLSLLNKTALDAYSDATTYTTSEKKGLVIYNDASNCIEFWNGSRWVSFCEGVGDKWFYMPSISIDVSDDGTFTRDLYLEYRKQFDDAMDSSTSTASPDPGTALIGSPGAPGDPSFTPFTKIYAANELYYYVIGYDSDVFSGISIAADGKLTYTVDADNVTGATFMNIVFVVK